MAAAAEELLPSEALTENSAEVLSFITKHEKRHGSRPEPTYFLTGAEEHDRVELTEGLYDLFKQLVGALARGQAVQIFSRDTEITTQQAAEILGLSRPTVVQLVDKGVIPGHVPGVSRRKLRLQDVLAYRDHLYEQRSQFIAESSEAYGDDEDPTVVSELLAQARTNR